jgi:hypothetical protein
MRYGILQKTNKKYNIDRIKNLKALYSGGEKYEDRIGEFITPSATDPHYVTELKKNLAKMCHTNHMSVVVNFTAGFLFEHPIVVRPEEEMEIPESYKMFREDVDGKGTDLDSFVRKVFTDAAHQKRAGWRIVTPLVDSDELMPLTKKSAEELMSNIKLDAFDAEELLDWKYNENGKLDWCKIRKVSCYHETPWDENMTTHETYLIYDKKNIYRFDVKWLGNSVPNIMSDVGFATTYEHGFDEVPVVLIDIPEGEFLGDSLYAPQIRNIRAEVANQWTLAKSSFSQPVFKCEKPETAENMLRSKTAIVLGNNDDVKFLEPDSSAMPNIANAVALSRDDLYRVGNMHFSNVENKSFAWRSASAKMIDKSTGMTMIKNYGVLVREAIEKTYQFISDAKGDEIEWCVEGFEKIQTMDPETLIAIAKELPNIFIQPTAMKEFTIRFANALVPDLSDKARQQVNDEDLYLGGAEKEEEGDETTPIGVAIPEVEGEDSEENTDENE